MTSSIACEIERFVESLVLEEGRSENTCVSYGSDLRFFGKFLEKRGRRDPNEITREDISDFLAEEREKGMLGSTRARRTAAIRVFMRSLKARHRIDHNPAELLDPPKRPKALPRLLSEEETARLLDEISGEAPVDLRDRAMLEVMYGCGLRVSETCDLKMEDLVGEGELLRVLGKGSKERIVPIGQKAGAALVRYFTSARASFTRGNLAETHVFVTRLGRAFTRQGVFKIIRGRAAAVGIPANRISPHVLRHCFASHLLAHGADIRAIQELLGHANIATTQVYTHIDIAKFTELHKRFHPRAL